MKRSTFVAKFITIYDPRPLSRDIEYSFSPVQGVPMWHPLTEQIDKAETILTYE
jgi:hypothetical protein